MPTPRERLDAIQEQLESAVRDAANGDRRVSYDLEVLRKERDRLTAQIAAQSANPRTTRTLLSMDPDE